MARIFGQMAAQPYDIFTMLSSDKAFKAFATATLERSTTDITPAFTYADNRALYNLGDITDGIEIVVLSDELRQNDLLLDGRTRQVRLVSILIGAFGSANINNAMIDISKALITRFGNAPTIEQVNDPVSYRGKIGPGEDNTTSYGGFLGGQVLTIKVGQERFIGEAVEPLAGEVGIPEAPADSKQYVRQNGQWVEVEVQSGPQPYYEFVDESTAATVRLSARRGSLVVTDPFTESVSQIDLGGTTVDAGTLTNVFIDGSGRYSVGASTLNNANGLATLEYINTPGQFFVINDIDGSVFGPGDRQSFGLVAEDIYDRSNLRGGVAPFSGGNSGGWSLTYSWYYTGGYPYAWTNYATQNQTPGGSGLSATGPLGSQTWQKKWWELATKAGVGKSHRAGIADGSLTDQTGQNFSNRLIMQLYYSQEMVDHPEFATLAPTSVQDNGVGWYTYCATAGEYENMGQFDNGNDKGYRFRWSTFGNTTLSQLPYVTGVANNDQITSASGQSHYIVYGIDAADKAAANSVLANGVASDTNRHWAAGTTIDVLQFEQPFDFPNTPAENVYPLKYTYISPVQASPLFNTYDLSTVESLTEAAQAVAPLEKLHASVCDEVKDAVTAYYLIRNLSQVQTEEGRVKLANALNAAVSGQLRTLWDAVQATVSDDGSPEGSGGVVLFPAVLKEAIQAKLELWMNTLPDN